MFFNSQANNPIFIVSCLWQGLKLVSHKQLRYYVIIPLVVNSIIYTITLMLSYFYLSDFIHDVMPTWLQWLSWLIFPILFIIFLIIGFFTFSTLANILLAPFYSYLSAKTMCVITGQIDNMIEQPFIKIFQSELKRLTYTLKRLIPLLLLFFIPVINMIAPILFTVFGAWILAMEYLAFPLDNKGILFNEQRIFIQQIRWGVLILGGLIMMGLTIPLLNIVFAPASVIGATIYVNQITKN